MDQITPDNGLPLIEDNELIKCSHEVDNFISEMGMKYGVSPLSLSAIISARLMLLNAEFGSIKNFQQLMYEISNNEFDRGETIQ